MRKMIMMGVLLASATSALAQTPPDVKQDHRQEMQQRKHEISTARQDNRQDQRQLQHENRLRHQELKGDMMQQRHELRQQRQEVRADQRDLQHDRRAWRQEHRRNDWHRDQDRGRGPVMIGYRMAPIYLGGRYDITNYGHYGIQGPRPGLRWVRYGHDLVLVNVRTARVVRVIRNRF